MKDTMLQMAPGGSNDELEVVRERLAQVKEPSALLEGFFAFAPFGLQVYRADGRCLLVNRAFRELFGSEPPPEYNVLRDDIAERSGLLDTIHRAFAGETVTLPATWYDPRELRTVTVPEGRRVAIEATFFPLRAATGAIEHVAVVFEDVTAETLALEAEQRSNGRLRLLVRVGEALSRASASPAITLKDAAAAVFPDLADWCAIDVLEKDGVIRRAAVTHRDPAKSEMGWRLVERHPLHLDQETGVARVIRSGQLMWGSEIPDEALVMEARDDEHLALLRGLGLKAAIVVPLVAHGRTLGAMSFVTAESGRTYAADDVPFAEEVAARVALAVENARAHEAAREAARVAEDANRAKDVFLSVVSHELRTPLNAILGWARMLSADDGEPTDPATFRQGLDVIKRNAAAQATIIDDILDVSRIITGKLRLSLHPVDLDTVVTGAIESLAPAAAARQIQLTREVGRDAMVLGDVDRLQQIVWNLLSNAIKFTAVGGHVRITVSREGEPRDEPTVVLRVADDGRGIDAAHLPFVFDRFHQIDASTTRSQGGLGLGLSIVRHLTELHGGRVTVTSEGLGRGATFTVELPRFSAAARASTTSDPPSLRSGARPLEGVRVLVVDDERDAMELVSAVLGRAGAEVRGAVSVREAMLTLADFVPHVVAADIGMPEEDGYALVERLKNLPAPARHAKTIAVTAFARDEDRTAAERAGFDVHLAKPVEPTALTDAVASLARSLRAPDG